MNLFSDVIRLAKDTREFLTPLATSSAFTSEGVLTAEEFVAAGDMLVSTCPTWTWGTPKDGEKSYLPEGKQYLVTKSVPSYLRVSDLNKATNVDTMIDAGEWVAPSFKVDTNSDNIDNQEFDIIGNSSSSNTEGTEKEEEDNKNDEYADMEDDSLALDNATANADTGTGGSNTMKAHRNSIVKARRYDIYLTYDKYYRTPRIWLYGYDESGSPLSSNQVFEDIMQNYAKKTVTIEYFPFDSGLNCASIHPCMHANAMKNILSSLSNCGKIPRADQSLFIFLKFVQSIVPGIEYDFTMDVQVKEGK